MAKSHRLRLTVEIDTDSEETAAKVEGLLDNDTIGWQNFIRNGLREETEVRDIAVVGRHSHQHVPGDRECETCYDVYKSKGLPSG